MGCGPICRDAGDQEGRSRRRTKAPGKQLTLRARNKLADEWNGIGGEGFGGWGPYSSRILGSLH